MSGHGYDVEADSNSASWAHRPRSDLAIRSDIRDLENTNHHEEFHRYKPFREMTKERMNTGISSRGSSPGQSIGPFDLPELFASSNGHNKSNRKKILSPRQDREEHKELQDKMRSKRDKAGDEWLRLSGLGRTKVRF